MWVVGLLWFDISKAKKQKNISFTLLLVNNRVSQFIF